MLVRRLLAPMFLLVMLSAVVLVSPRPAHAISAGCEMARTFVAVTTFPGLAGFYFDAGDHLTVTISNTAKDTTAELLIDSLVVDSAPLATGSSVTLEYTFPASGNYSVDSRSYPETATHQFGCTPAPSDAPTAKSAAPGPGIPYGFILRTITCDTPLYTTPNGSPVPGGAAVTTGQTWFVASEEATPGWVEGFFGGKNNAWLPAACIA
jgi:hypothetical protein